MLALATAAVCSSALAQCEDNLACNYQPGTSGTAECVYFDTDLFTLEELDEAINALRRGKATGLDGIAAELLQALSDRGRERFLQLMHRAWGGDVPQPWKVSKIMPQRS